MSSFSIFTTMTNPEDRNDPWKESINCYESLADEVVIVGDNWPVEFDWGIFNKIYQDGFDKCATDWVMRMDLDYFVHEKDIPKIRDSLEKYTEYPAIVLPQYQFFTLNRYQIKTKLCLLLNKKRFPEIKLNGGTDRMLATLNGELLTYKNVPQVKIPIWQYDSMFRTKSTIAEDRARFARAWYSQFKDWGDRGGPSEEEAFEAWFIMIKKRYAFHTNKISMRKHPKFICSKLQNLKQEHFGYSAFGLQNKTKRDLKQYLKGYKDRYLV